MVKESSGRLLSLEGLRVFASVIVVLFHATIMFYPGAVYGMNNDYAMAQNSHFEDNVYGNPLSALISGTFAVSIFFVLSGFVLTIGYFETKKHHTIRRLAAKRYIRLALPALASVLFAWILMSSSLADSKHEVAAITHSGWLDSLWQIPPNFYAAITQGVWGAFSIKDVSFNPVLWTIHYELIGSFVIFAFVLLFGDSPKRWIVYLFLCLALFNTWLIGFIFGVLLADLYSKNYFPFNIHNKRYLYMVGAIGVFFGGYPALRAAGRFYESLQLPALNSEQNQAFYTGIGALCIVICVLAIPRVSAWFAHKKVSGLGKYTYALYLVHLPILLTVCTTLFLPLHSHLNYHVAALAAVALTLPVIAITSYLFEQYIDAASIKLSSHFARWV